MQKIKLLLLALLMSLIMIVSQAVAAVPAGVATAFTTLETDFETIMGYVWPVATTIMIGFGILSLVKKAWGKTAGR